MRLSERLGIVAPRAALQGRSLDTSTRNRLWNAVALAIPSSGRGSLAHTWMGELFAQVWSEFYKLPVDDMPSSEAGVRTTIRETMLDGEWWEVYDLLEFLIASPINSNAAKLLSAVRDVLSQEWAGFQYIHNQFVEITDEAEIAAIEQSLSATQSDRFAPIRSHLTQALQLMSDRREPDYRNSIKESISAVEAVAQILTGERSAELSKALKLLHTTTPIHGALRSALMSLYGYTSDADGIRHALTDETNLDAADAKFMLVACAAFVVYLIQKTAR